LKLVINTGYQSLKLQLVKKIDVYFKHPENRLDRDFLLGADLVDLVAAFLAGDFSHINSFNNQSTSPDSILDWLLFYRETPD